LYSRTSQAKRRARTVIALDVPSQLQIAEADPDAFLDGISPILIDEWQRFPPIWDAVQRNVDDEEKDGVFILTGSAYVPDAKIHSGSLRIHELRMHPMSLPKRGVVSPTISLGALLHGEKGIKGNAIDFGLREYVKEIAASGFPGIRNMPAKLQSAELGSYSTNIVTKDFVEAGYKVRKPAALLGWIRAYAAATSTNMSYEKIRGMTLP
jgi:predicted AAA+ superfamily ATPase